VAALFTLAAIEVFIPLPTRAAFKAACVKVDITPEESTWIHTFGKRKSTGVLHPIYHKVVAMSDGETEFYLVSSDLIGFSAPFYDAFCKLIGNSI
jgi:neutral ceramidase